MDTKKRKAQDGDSVRPLKRHDSSRFPKSDLSSKDAYYHNLYKHEIDFRQLAKQDRDFAAMYMLNLPLFIFTC